MAFRSNINNILEAKSRELTSIGVTSFEYENLYSNIENEKLRNIFIWLHGGFMNLFRRMNERLPAPSCGAHFWADESRELISIIDVTITLWGALKNTECAFSIDEYYETLIKMCRDFLSKSGGSTLPPYMNKVELCYVEPIFRLTESVIISRECHSFTSNLKPIGNGSYAKVFRYTDSYYHRDFVLKRANKDLNEKELQRFKREFEEMQSLHSPYIVEVYSYNEDKHEYIMELMDYTLEKYIDRHNSSMKVQERKNIIMQLLRAFGYLHSKKIYHRDISPKNVLIKEYDDTLVVKLSDFGLVKIVDSDLTSENTDMKGSLNDPALKVEGFGNYGLSHELYAITLLFTYILTGKTNWANVTDPIVKPFMDKGTNQDKAKRFQTLEELGEAAKSCIKKLSAAGVARQ